MAIRTGLISRALFSQRLFSTLTKEKMQNGERHKVAQITKESFISAQYKRDIIEKKLRSEKPKEYVIDGLPEPENPCYPEMMKRMFDELKKTKAGSKN